MNTNIRIKNSQGLWATVWSISEHFYSLQYDGEPLAATTTITGGQLEVLKKYSHAIKTTDEFGNVNITDNGKLKINEYGEYSVEYPRGLDNVPFDAYTTKLHQGESVVNTEKELPKTFKFYYKGDANLIYTYTNYHNNDRAEITWTDKLDGSQQNTDYDVDIVRKHIANGAWIVLSSVNPDVLPTESLPEQKNIIDTIQIKIELEGLEEAKKAVGELAEASNTLLESIKSFTSGTGHDVFISEGIYKVYRSQEDMPYICHTDEQVVAVMDALITLDEAGKEGEGRFFTLNVEGIL